MHGPRNCRRRTARPWLVPALALTLTAQAGCGYSVRAPFKKSVKTVYVPVFRSVSFRRDENLQLTELVIKEIERRTPFKVVGSPEGADTVLEGLVNLTDKNTVVENPYNMPRQLSASVTSAVKWYRNPPLAAEQNADPVIVTETVNFNPEIGETAMTGFYRANQRLAQQIVDMMEDPWPGE
jgi:hypothetical protein